MVDVHASGGLKMMEEAKKILEPYGKDAPLLIAVTVLTSMEDLIYYKSVLILHHLNMYYVLRI